MDKILAAIITYNPEIERLKRNIYSIKEQCDYIIIIDNYSRNVKEIEELRIISNKIKIICNSENKGIASALNQALDYANNNNYKWMITLDQDSICQINMINKIKKEYMTLINNNIAIMAPEIVYEKYKEMKNDKENKELKIEDCLTVITSGTILNVEKAISVNGFEDDLFIDYVDHDFCFKLKQKGYDIFKVKNAELYHELGDMRIYKFMGIKATSTNHNAIRRYYYFRNMIYMNRKYGNIFHTWLVQDRKRNIKAIIAIIIFEKNKISKLKNIYWGIKDGLNEKYGKYDYSNK